MLATKNRVANKWIFFLALTFILAGCAPPGPRALLAGKRLIEKGRYEQAVVELKTATLLLATNAQAWNYLGIACHHAGQINEAVQAYQKALSLNHDLAEARYNLGCLWLEQNKLDAAKTELTAFTLRRGNSTEGWLKLGTVQLRSRDLNAAVKCFNEALRLSPQQPEALNGLGLILLQRKQAREAAQYFAAAVNKQPDYAPAWLNLAVVCQTYLDDRQSALQDYRAYLALKPHPPNWEAVGAAARALEQEIALASRQPAATSLTTQTNQREATTKTVTKVPTVASQPNTSPATRPPKTVPANVQLVRVEPEPKIESKPELAARNSANDLIPPPDKAESEPAKRGFFQRINPLNLFRHEPKSVQQPTPLPSPGDSSASEVTTPAVEPRVTTVAASPKGASMPVSAAFPRYAYHSPVKPNPGDRNQAERSFTQGVEYYRTGRFAEAVQSYRLAIQSDPAYFEAYYNLGLAASAVGNLPQSLAAYESALALSPDSIDTRYNFALTLKRANYPLDAANEFQKILADNPREVRAHLALANLYAQQFHQPAKAREHYLKVLQYDPNNSQATAIRFWLSANPP